MTANNQLDALKQLILKLLVQGASLPTLIETIAKQQAIQCMILDERACLLLHSQTLFYQDEYWQCFLKNGRIPYSFILEQPQLLETFWQLSQKQTPLKELAIKENYTIWLAPIFHENILAGYIVLLAAADLPEEQVSDLNALLSQLFLHKNAKQLKQLKQCDDLFVATISWELLISDSEDSLEWLQKLPDFIPMQKTLRLPALQPPFLLAALSIQQAKPDPKLLAKLGQTLRNYEANLYFAVEGTELLLLFVQANDLFLPRYQKLLAAFAAKYRLFSGISSVFPSLATRKFAKKQAHDTLLICQQQNQSGHILTADDVYPQLLLQATAEHWGSEILLREDLKRLIAYDKKNGTDYLDTLANYLYYGGNLTRAANHLYIDRSTLKYRLKKIQAVMECSLTDPQTAFELLLNIYLHQLIK